ncbi:MAG: hypothetical protein V1820_02980 [archaeon]
MKVRERGRIRKGLAPVAIMLILLLTLSIALSAWLVISGLNNQAKTQAEADAAAARKKISTGIAIDGIDSNRLFIRNSGKGRINDVSVYVDNVPIEIVEQFRGLDAGQSGEISLEKAPTFGDHRIKIIANSAVQDEITVSGRALSGFDARIPIRVTNQYPRDYRSVWAFGGSGKNVTISIPVSSRTSVVLDSEGLEYPSRVKTSWYDPAWKKRRPLVFSDLSGVGFSGEPVEFTLSSLALSTGRCEEVRITDDSGALVRSDFVSGSGATCKFRMQFFSPPNGSTRYYAYYANPTAEIQNAETGINVSEMGDRLCLDNGKLLVCLGLDKGGVLNISESEMQNLLAENVGPDGKYSGLAPSVKYKEGWDYSVCSPYRFSEYAITEGSKDHAGKTNSTSGASKKIGVKVSSTRTIVEYVFGTTCSGTEYLYKYLLTIYPDTLFYDIEIQNLAQIDFGGSLQNFFAQANWAKVYPSGNSVVADGNYSAYWNEKIPDGTGIGVVALELSPRAIAGFLRPPSFIVVEDSEPLQAGTIISARTVLSKNYAGAEETRRAFIRSQGGYINISEGGDEGIPVNTTATVDFALAIDKGASRSVYFYYADRGPEGASREKPEHPSSISGYALEASLVGKEERLSSR